MKDDEAPTFEQRFQGEAGSSLAIRSALTALIATHPDKPEFLRALAGYDETTQRILDVPLALAHDDGLRAAYEKSMRAFREAAQS